MTKEVDLEFNGVRMLCEVSVKCSVFQTHTTTTRLAWTTAAAATRLARKQVQELAISKLMISIATQSPGQRPTNVEEHVKYLVLVGTMATLLSRGRRRWA